MPAGSVPTAPVINQELGSTFQITGIGNDADAEAQTRSDLALLRGLPGGRPPPGVR